MNRHYPRKGRGSKLRKYLVILSVFLAALFFAAGCRKAPTVITPRPSEPEGPPPPHAQISSLAAQNQFKSAESYFLQKDFEHALSEFQNFVIRFPKDLLTDDAFYYIGQIYLIRNDPYMAAIALERIPRDFPTGDRLADTYPFLAQAYDLMGRYDEAEAALRNQLNFSYDRDQRCAIYQTLAKLLQKQKRSVQALEALEKSWALADTPALKNEIRSYGEAVIDEIQDEESLVQIARNFPGSLAGQLASIKLGDIYRSRRQFAEARQELQNVIAYPVAPEFGERAQVILDKIMEYSSVDRLAVGCILPLSGEHEEYGNKLTQAIELASRQYLLESGLPAIKLFFQDSRGEPETAREAVRHLVRVRKVIGVIGPLVGKAAAAAAEEAQSLEVPIITLTPREGVPELGDYVFRNFLTAIHQIRFLVSYTMETLGLTRFAVLYPDDDYGKRYMNLFWDEVESRNGYITSAESYNRDQTDFSEQIKKLVGMYYSESTKPVIDFQALLIPDTDYKVGLIAPQLGYFDVVGVYLLGTSLWNTPILTQMAGPFLEKALFVDGFFAQSSMPQVREFVDSYRASYGQEPDIWAAHAFDTACILFDLLIKHNISSRMELRDKLRQVRNHQGVTGDTSFTSGGEVSKVPFILTVKNNQITEVGFNPPVERNNITETSIISSQPGHTKPDNPPSPDPFNPLY